MTTKGVNEIGYGQYRQSRVLRLKNGIRKFLKSARVDKGIYQVCQKIWRAYAIPKRQKRLQREGAQALERLHRLMQKNHIPYYCDYGTLIGFVRDNGFIKHDDDIDITIQPNTVKAVDVLKVFLDAGYGYVHGFKYESKFLEFTVADVSGITIDVFFPDLLGDGKVQAYQPIWEPGKKYPSENANTLIQYVFEEATGLKTIQVVGTATTIPGNYDQVLTSEYGPWKVPDAKFNTVTDRVHKEMPGFAYRMTQEEALSFV